MYSSFNRQAGASLSFTVNRLMANFVITLQIIIAVFVIIDNHVRLSGQWGGSKINVPASSSLLTMFNERSYYDAIGTNKRQISELINWARMKGNTVIFWENE